MKKSIIYIYSESSSFIRKDINIFSKNYNVLTPKYEWKNNKLIPLYLIKQLLFLLQNIRSSEVIVVKFGGYWSLIPSIIGKLFKKPIFILLGGADCVSFPSINYGCLRKPILKLFLYLSYRLCSKLVPVDEALVHCDNNYYEESHFKYQGFKYFFPNIMTPIDIIHNGYDPDIFSIGNTQKRNNSFVTLAAISSIATFYRKGVDKVLQIADSFPDCSFTIIGITNQIKSEIKEIPKNVFMYPHLPSDEFIHYLRENEFVLHLAIFEGFPNALCEAMLCECIPIGSNVGAISHIIEGAGFLMKSSNTDYLKNELSKILGIPDENRKILSKKSRHRIIDNYHISNREKALFELIEHHH